MANKRLAMTFGVILVIAIESWEQGPNERRGMLANLSTRTTGKDSERPQENAVQHLPIFFSELRFLLRHDRNPSTSSVESWVA